MPVEFSRTAFVHKFKQSHSPDKIPKAEYNSVLGWIVTWRNLGFTMVKARPGMVSRYGGVWER